MVLGAIVCVLARCLGMVLGSAVGLLVALLGAVLGAMSVWWGYCALEFEHWVLESFVLRMCRSLFELEDFCILECDQAGDFCGDI